VQRADGRIDDGRIEGPCVWAGVTTDGIPAAQARRLGEILIAAEVGGWKSPCAENGTAASTVLSASTQPAG
jgi:hypothetical protein